MRRAVFLLLALLLVITSAGARAQTSAVEQSAAAPSPPIAIAQAQPFDRPHDLSPLGMFKNADVVVKAVMICLALASLTSWTIAIAKFLELSTARRGLRRTLRMAGDLASLAEAEVRLARDGTIVGGLIAAARREIDLSGRSGAEGINERCASRFAELTRFEAQRARRGMSILATIGAISPFVGLFGTVWGIMNSFIGISETNTTSLAVVAPGIAEALLATACGLFAAIPAVVIYNQISQWLRRHQLLVAEASGTVLRLVSRDLGRLEPRSGLRAAE